MDGTTIINTALRLPEDDCGVVVITRPLPDLKGNRLIATAVRTPEGHIALLGEIKILAPIKPGYEEVDAELNKVRLLSEIQQGFESLLQRAVTRDQLLG